MADISIDQINAAIKAAQAKDPRLIPLLKAVQDAKSKQNYSIPEIQQAENAYYAALREDGIPVPQAGYNQANSEAFIDFGNGLARSDPKAQDSWKTALIGLGAVGGFGLAAPFIAGATAGSAAGGGASAAGGAGAAGSTIGPSTAANMAATEAATTVPTGIAAPAVGGAIAPVIAKNVGSSALGWASLAGQIATPIVGGIFANNANTDAQQIATEGQLKAAQIQADSTKAALDFAKQGYVTQQEQLAPYVGTGGAAMTKLSQLSGLGTPKPYVPPPSLQNIGAIAPGGSTGALGPSAGTSGPSATATSPMASNSAMVTLRAPNGDTAQKPASEAQHWISLGAQVVPSQAGA